MTRRSWRAAVRLVRAAVDCLGLVRQNIRIRLAEWADARALADGAPLNLADRIARL